MRNSGELERQHLFSLNGALVMGTGLVGSLLGGGLKDGLVAIGFDEILAYRAALLAGAAFVLAAVVPFSRIAPTPLAPRAPGVRVGRLDGIDVALWAKLIIPSFLVGIAAGQISTFVGIAAGPLLAKRLGKPRAVFWTQILSVPLILVLGWVRALPLALLAYFARQVLMNMSAPIQDNFALELVPPERQSLLNAVKMLSWTGSWTVAARVSGELIYRGGFATSFALTAALYLASTVCYRAFFIPRRRVGRSD
jgi:hypothetical protein